MSETFEEWFDRFYNSKEAQNFCFGNNNNASRDEQVGEFSAKSAWNHQQAKIDQLKAENKKLKGVIDCFDAYINEFDLHEDFNLFARDY